MNVSLPTFASLLSAVGMSVAIGLPVVAQEGANPEASPFSSEPIVAPAEGFSDIPLEASGAPAEPSLQRVEIERIIEQEVDEVVARNFSWTIGLLNLLLLLLVVAPVSAIAMLWLMRSSLVSKIVREVEQHFGSRLGANLHDEILHELRSELRNELHNAPLGRTHSSSHEDLQVSTARHASPQSKSQPQSSNPERSSVDRPPTSIPPQAIPTHPDSGKAGAVTAAAEQRIKEMVLMALSVQQSISTQSISTTAQPPLDSAVHTESRLGERLEDLFDYQLTRANQLEREAKYTEALAAYERAIEIEPNMPLAHCARGTLFVRLQRFDEAIAAFDRALTVRADCAEARYGKACCFASVGYGDRAIEELQATIALRPELKVAAQSDPLLATLRDREWFQTEVVG